MASHPYISGAGNLTQMIRHLRRTFPQSVTADIVKRLGIAPKNESFVINALQYLTLVEADGKRTERGHQIMTIHDEDQFQKAFGELVKEAYQDLFELHGDDAWNMTRTQLIGFFRGADKTSDVIGGRQAGVFIALRELAGHVSEAGATVPRVKAAGKAKAPAKKAVKAAGQSTKDTVQDPPPPAPSLKQQKGEMALTVRIEINLPAEGSQATYDAIFKSIKANLYPS